MDHTPDDKKKKIILAVITTGVIISTIISCVLIVTVIRLRLQKASQKEDANEYVNSPAVTYDSSAADEADSAPENAEDTVTETEENTVTETEADAVAETEKDSAIETEAEISDSDPKLLVDSTVVLLGDTMTIRFFDGENTYAYDSELIYYSQPNTVDISADNSRYRNYLIARSGGTSTVTGEMNGLELSKIIYVVNPGEASSRVICDTKEIAFPVTASGPGAVNIKLSVDGWKKEKLEVRFYTNGGNNFKGDVWVSVDAKWENDILKATVTNYLSAAKEGELVIVISEKGKPDSLVGYCRIPIKVG